ncbi:GNAT family N-acetyltransferase [Paenibacillus sp. DMB20]|uniref:GNAT family N-acetyltransferase n=1 Tax=Paenibacillus sp. DMB20 TaxID=1642570 RepID=UPI00062803B4|nr:GNAT family N-acetyltransferase [Paenibacillus sp. DMB20]KKO52570.1 acetyltransferase [Paenibacillus sp. DMB20]
MIHGQPKFQTAPMQAEHAAEICTWSYPPPYNIYGWLPWEQMVQLGIEFGDPYIRQQQYVSILDEKRRLWGFAQLFPMEGVLRIGLGMRPDWCGNGMGKRFVEAVVREARQRKPHDEIDLEVLTWNERAIRTYRKAGFVITDSYERMTPSGMAMFYCMVYSPPRSGSHSSQHQP